MNKNSIIRLSKLNLKGFLKALIYYIFILIREMIESVVFHVGPKDQEESTLSYESANLNWKTKPTVSMKAVKLYCIYNTFIFSLLGETVLNCCHP